MNAPAGLRAGFAGRWLGRDRLLGRIVLNAGILVLGKGANAVFSLAYLALAVRALGIDGLGLLVLIHTYAQAVGEIAKFRSWQAVLRYGAPALHDGQHGRLQSLLRLTLALDAASSIGAALLAVAGAGLAARLLDWPAELVPAATLYGLSVLLVAPATATGLLRLFDRFDLLAVHSAVSSLVRLVGAALLLALGAGLVGFLVLWFVSGLAASMVLVACAARELARRGLLAGLRGPLRGIGAIHPGVWRFIWATNLNTSVATLSTHLPTLLTGGLLGAGEAGLLRIARELAEALAKPTKLLVPAIFPELARLSAGGDHLQMRELVWRALALAAAAALACFLAIALLGDELLRLVIGGAPVPYALMLLLGGASLITLWLFPLEPLLISVGRESAALRARLVATAVFAVLLVVLIPSAGLTGAGLAALGAALVLAAGQIAPSLAWLRRHRTAAVTESEQFSGERLAVQHTLASARRQK